jgi:hypothetical protein
MLEERKKKRKNYVNIPWKKNAFACAKTDMDFSNNRKQLSKASRAARKHLRLLKDRIMNRIVKIVLCSPHET